MYDRSTEDGELRFEASGALEKASLVMRDRETDSWWSLMSSNAIGGALAGQALKELPVGKKMTWGRWRQRHPDTVALSVDGVEHEENNPYDQYFTEDGTFRGIEIDDDRLAPKASIYSFWHEGAPYAIAHEDIAGGHTVELEGRTLFFHRRAGASIFESTLAFSLPPDVDTRDADALSARLDRGDITNAEPLGGFDTFWYTWIGVNPTTELLRR